MFWRMLLCYMQVSCVCYVSAAGGMVDGQDASDCVNRWRGGASHAASGGAHNCMENGRPLWSSQTMTGGNYQSESTRALVYYSRGYTYGWGGMKRKRRGNRMSARPGQMRAWYGHVALTCGRTGITIQPWLVKANS